MTEDKNQLLPGEKYELEKIAAEQLNTLITLLYSDFKFDRNKTELPIGDAFVVRRVPNENHKKFLFEVFKDGKIIGQLVALERSVMTARPPVEVAQLLSPDGAIVSESRDDTQSTTNLSAGSRELCDFIHASKKEVNRRIELFQEEQRRLTGVLEARTSEPQRDTSKMNTEVYLQPKVEIIDLNFEAVNSDLAVKALRSNPLVEKLLPFLPTRIQQMLEFEDMPKSESISTVTPEEFIKHMNSLAVLVSSKSLEHFGPESTQLCMNLAVIITKYIHEIFRFPVVGLYKPEDESLPYYVRPTTTLFDRKPVYSEFISKSGRFSMEDCVEVKIGDRIFIVDYNYFYQAEDRASLVEELTGHKNLGSKQLLVFEVTTLEQRKDLEKLGIITIQYQDFNPQEISTEASGWYYTHLGNYFMITVGDPIADAQYRKSITDGYANIFVSTRSHATVEQYIQKMSAGALISYGVPVNDLTGRGRNFILDPNQKQRDSIKEHALLLNMLENRL